MKPTIVGLVAVKLNTHIQWQEKEREIRMDGRPHPPEYAAHTWAYQSLQEKK
jgi:hypothetical protein